ncbi:arginine--tRNA ligase [Bacillus sp. REN16]|uniref:arginine--tRNA ligase n=1 Tax=Bacillus sp. REN16 TaxID=2887296 RepID=UPI001E54FCC7|nr:arginine--tRNA ligase [Bacillus sp. REN16]MCC3355486.1 arginine--tRNA ligase [Bacillus sp. REN16]
MNVIEIYAEALSKCLQDALTYDEVLQLIEKPKFQEQGDLAFPCFTLAKQYRKAPVVIAQEIAPSIQEPLFEKVVAEGPYVNCFLNKEEVSKHILQSILTKGSQYGSEDIGEGGAITIDFSSPNIAKPFSMGHLRSTVIGNALANIVEKCGYQPIRINHLGDWGTQFGKLIVAYKLWGNKKAVQKNPITELLQLYVRFHSVAETQPELDDEARLWFKKLEDGDEEALSLWRWFRVESLKEFSRIYSLLGVVFDSYNGEAFYNDKMDAAIVLLNEINLLSESDGAEVVDLSEVGLPPCLIKKSDGATLYATRDVTAAIYRQENYHFKKAIYVVGHEQSLHFKQIFLVLEKMGFGWAKNMVHVPFGFILKDGKKMSTRKGKIVLLEQVIEEAIDLAKRNINVKNPNLENKEEIAKNVGVGAIIFHDLKNDRLNNIEFSLEEMLKFEGSTGPYVQYTHARACSILRKAAVLNFPTKGLSDSHSWSVVKLLIEFPTMVQRSMQLYEPSVIAKYMIELAQEFNKYYSHVKVLHKDDEMNDRVALVRSVTIVLKEGLRLLGVKAPEEM